jgi:hypothetical protein
VVTASLLVAACGGTQEPTAAPPTRRVEAVALAPTSPQTGPAAAPDSETRRVMEGLAAQRRERSAQHLPGAEGAMPDDGVHAQFRQARAAEQAQLPPGHPPIAGPGGGASMGGPGMGGAAMAMAAPADGAAGMAEAAGMGGADLAAPRGHGTASQGVESDQELPLPLEGAGGVAELTKRLAVVADPALRAKVASAFRKTFTLARAKRDPQGAAALLAGLDAGAVGATAQRILGYVAVSNGFDVPAAMGHYNQAVALDPNYGEAHYALAFMHVMSDLAAGRVHFDKARALGVPDTNRLGEQYYR